MKSHILLFGAAAAAIPGLGAAQTAAQPGTVPATNPAAAAAETVVDEEGEIVVTGQRERGSVAGDIQPEQQLRAADIRAYGVSSLTDLLTELSPQTSSGRGRGGEMPVVLLNGRRISSMAEIRDIPTEAIERVDILPEEVSLKFGYSANQRVVNFVLRRRFRSEVAELTGGAATAGGYVTGRAELDLLRIRNDGRFSLGLDYRQTGDVTEAERNVTAQTGGRTFDYIGNVVNPAGGAVDPALSAALGQAVTVAGVPVSAALGRPALSAFLPTANVSAIGDIRTLTPAAKNLSVNAVYSHPISAKVSATANVTLGTTTSDALRGPASASLLVPAGDPFSPFTQAVQLNRYLGNLLPLKQSSSGTTAHVGGTLSGDFTDWRWTVTGNYDHAHSSTISDTGVDTSLVQALLNARSATFNPFALIDPALLPGRAADLAHSTNDSGDAQAVLSGPLLALPAGKANATVRVGGAFTSLDASSFRSGLVQSSDLSRRSGNAQVNLDLPITSRARDVLGAIGTLSLNANAEVERLSDFGTLVTYGYGLHYSPRDRISFIASYTHEEGAPTLTQLGAPQILTLNTLTYDAVQGRTVSASLLSGGNPDLLANSRSVVKLGLNVKPFARTDLNFTIDFNSSRTKNLTGALPIAVAEAEAAFPDRFTRDANGTLTRIDVRPVNFAREDREQLRWGFNFSKPIKSDFTRLIAAFRKEYPNGPPRGTFPGPGGQRPPGAPGGAPGAGGPPAGGGAPGGGGFAGGGGGRGPGGGGPGGRFGGGGAQNGGRLQLAFYHTWHFKDETLIRPGIPVIDLLNGGATGSAGGQPRHEFELQSGYSNNGLGLRLSGRYQTSTTVDGSNAALAGTTGDLRFSDLTTFDLRLFANLQQIPELVPFHWMRGMRVSIGVNNLFDARLKVRDQTGVTPVGYQPGIINPIGRVVSVSVRKLFF